MERIKRFRGLQPSLRGLVEKMIYDGETYRLRNGVHEVLACHIFIKLMDIDNADMTFNESVNYIENAIIQWQKEWKNEGI